jgi:acetyl-CoA synthetase (ADP-forming)
MKVDFSKLDRAFNPKTVAVVGASKKNHFHWLRNLREFQGKVYSVQVNPESIEGIKALGIENVTSLLEIPVPVDLVIVNTPRALALQILEDCILKEAGAVHFFSSGFGETGQEEGMDLERSLVEKAERTGFHIVGINCRGIFTPKIGLKQISEQYSGPSGPVGLISQSGGHAMTFSRQAFLQGLYINKSISFGNGIVLDAGDFLEYFGQNPEIEAIGMYLEGVKDGRRFLDVLKKVSAQKPVVILKGGRTSDGGRAITSHTGSLAIPEGIWNAAMRQSGAISVPGLDEMIDTLKALLYLPPMPGERIGVAGGAGGESIAITDLLAENGLKVPELTQKSYDELDTFFSLVGGSCRNPIDTDIGPNRRHLERVLMILANDPNIDNLILMTRVGEFLYSKDLREKDIEIARNLKQNTTKPLVVVLPFVTPEEMKETIEIIPRYQGCGIPVFPTMNRAAVALKNTLGYHRFRKWMVDD